MSARFDTLKKTRPGEFVMVFNPIANGLLSDWERKHHRASSAIAAKNRIAPPNRTLRERLSSRIFSAIKNVLQGAVFPAGHLEHDVCLTHARDLP